MIAALSRAYPLTVEDLGAVNMALRKYIDDEEVCRLLLQHLLNILERNEVALASTTDVSRTAVELQKRRFPSVELELLRAIRRLSELGNTAVLFDCIDMLPSSLRRSDVDVQSLACDCVSNLCNSSIAIQSFLCANGMLSLSFILFEGRENLVVRGLYALHKLSTDLNCAKEICQVGLVPFLTSMLGMESLNESVGGILQNIGREKSSWPVLVASGVVERIVPLLHSPNTTVQTLAVGVIMNMHQGHSESREILRSILSDHVACTIAEK